VSVCSFSRSLASRAARPRPHEMVSVAYSPYSSSRMIVTPVKTIAADTKMNGTVLNRRVADAAGNWRYSTT